MTLDVAVVGGGVSGLYAAYELARRGHRVAVLERQARAGGNAISERLGGFLMEHGPSTVSPAAPAAAVASSALGLDAVRCGLGPGVRRRYLVKDGALAGIAVHPLGFLTASYLSPGARARLLAEALVPRRGAESGEETVAAFCRRRFGREFAERVIEPLVQGLYAGDANALSVAAVFPRLVEMERSHGSILSAVLRSRLHKGSMPARRPFSWRDGVGTLPAALARALGERVATGVAVRRLRPVRGGFRIEAGGAGTRLARSVVIATQPHVAAGLLDGLDEPAAAATAAIEAPPLAVVFLGYRRDRVAHPLDGLGYLVPAAEGRAATGALFPSTMFVGRAPAGHVALCAYFSGVRTPALAAMTPDELIAVAQSEFRDLLGARGAPALARVRVWPRGLPQYRLGHAGRTDRLRGAERRLPGLFLTGNYVAGPSIGACLGEARATATRVDAHLRGRAAGDAPAIAVAGGL